MVKKIPEGNRTVERKYRRIRISWSYQLLAQPASKFVPVLLCGVTSPQSSILVTTEPTMQNLLRYALPTKPTRRSQLPCRTLDQVALTLHGKSLTKTPVPLAANWLVETPLQCFAGKVTAPQASEATATTSNRVMTGQQATPLPPLKCYYLLCHHASLPLVNMTAMALNITSTNLRVQPGCVNTQILYCTLFMIKKNCFLAIVFAKCLKRQMKILILTESMCKDGVVLPVHKL